MVGMMQDFKVTITQKSRVAASLPFQEHWLPLSNLDLLLPPVDVGLFFCYQKPHALPNVNQPTFTSAVESLRRSLAQLLVTYYPFAGELVENSAGEAELLCNNRGVEFIEAYADVGLGQLNLYKPEESVEEKLAPKREGGVLCVQATELKCGGLVLACSFDHRIADAYSANMFFVSWAECAQLKQMSLPPSFRRSLLNPRRPGHRMPYLDDLYVPLSFLPPPKNSEDRLISRIYNISAANVEHIQALANTINGIKITKLQAFSAYLWKIIGEGMKDDAKICKVGIVVDGRTRLSSIKGMFPSITSYFGNVLSVTYGKLSVGSLKTMELSEVANVVHGMIKDAATGEHFLDFIDWIDEHRPDSVRSKIHYDQPEDGAAFMVSSQQRFPVTQVEFGWGKPVFGSYHIAWGGNVGHVAPMPSVAGNGGWVVLARLMRWQLELVEAAAGDVFQPFTPHHLKLAK